MLVVNFFIFWQLFALTCHGFLNFLRSSSIRSDEHFRVSSLWSKLVSDNWSRLSQHPSRPVPITTLRILGLSKCACNCDPQTKSGFLGVLICPTTANKLKRKKNTDWMSFILAQGHTLHLRHSRLPSHRTLNYTLSWRILHATFDAETPSHTFREGGGRAKLAPRIQFLLVCDQQPYIFWWGTFHSTQRRFWQSLKRKPWPRGSSCNQPSG